MKRLLMLALVILVLTASCGGKKEVKKVSAESLAATEAFALAEILREAYLKKDLNTIEKNSTNKGFREISMAIKSFDSAELSFNPVWVEIEAGVVNMNVSWNGRWNKAGKITEERGMAVFIMKEKPLRVDAILRSNPFKHPD